MSPRSSLVLIPWRRPAPLADEGVPRRAARLVEAYDVAGAVWQDVDSADMRRCEWLCGLRDGLRHRMCAVQAIHGTDTLASSNAARREGRSRYLFNPGPVMTSARVKAALVHHDIATRRGLLGVVRAAAEAAPVFGASPGMKCCW